ncbi:thiol:disulfide interchange protein DsbA/DsbL [Legionella maioricensis]|uniref:Thiol:disulfide interchange protein n=1 Tax=Legionella maioricensis TaxID=2896528 RepID=A0A9X2D0Z8_9GAMM|nr:thiol:disulfide interchange protein DsbA/DsbL [Legionella maioricensis]MCL9684461.1 thiol:disulfide interchange protein DsbA/DsbL [Legionella maioricensis]MCL9688836.1 thiol:disulfide interchange protein DsbA/DsbL [Legionella maioricensis]
MLRKLVGLIILLPAIALAAAFTEGKDYQVVSNPQATENKSKTPVVTEFFSYGCPWCYRMEAPLNEWVGKMGKNAQLERIPVVFKPDWELYAKAYYTAKTLALSDKLNPALFKAIQEDKKTLNTKQSMIDFFVGQGVDREIAKSAFENSPTIDMHVGNGMRLMAAYQINAVPAFVINNKYKTDLQMAGSPERLFQILDYLMRQPA